MEADCMGLALIVHGGAGNVPVERHAAARDGAREAAIAGWRVLRAGGSALDAVQAAIMALEDNPGFNAGVGSVLTADGRAELDAGLMDGATLDVGAVAGVTHIRQPIALARAVLTSPHVLLVGAGAEQFAEAHGIALVDNSVLVTPAQRARWRRGYQDGDDAHVDPADEAAAALDEGAVADTQEAPAQANPTPAAPAAQQTKADGAKARRAKADGAAPIPAARSRADAAIHADDTKHGTVGAVAVDAAGNVAAGASTGGIAAKHPGRVGDTPLVGCGYCAENGLGGVSSTGHGEDFIRLTLARRALDFIARGLSAQAAANAAITLLDTRVHGSGGLILLDGEGRVGFARNTLAMAHAYIVEGMDAPVAGV